MKFQLLCCSFYFLLLRINHSTAQADFVENTFYKIYLKVFPDWYSSSNESYLDLPTNLSISIPLVSTTLDSARKFYSTVFAEIGQKSFPFLTFSNTAEKSTLTSTSSDFFVLNCIVVGVRFLQIFPVTSSPNAIELGHEKGVKHCQDVILTFSDLAYVDAFGNWYNMTNVDRTNRKLSADSNCNYIVTLGAITHYLQQKKKNNILMLVPGSLKTLMSNDTEQYTHEFKMNYFVGMSKLIFPYIFLNYGIDVLVSEMDIFWKKNCLNELNLPENKNYDVQVTSHIEYSSIFTIGKGEVNIGLYYIRSTNASMIMYNNMMEYLYHQHKLLGTHRTWDQKLFDRFLRNPIKDGDDPPGWDDKLPNVGAFLNSSSTLNTGLNFRRLPINYTHNLKGENNKKNYHSKVQYHENTMTVHISWGINAPKDRIYCAYKLGLLIDESYQPPPKHVNFCFQIFDENAVQVNQI